MTLRLTSPAFAPGELIPRRFTGEGEDLSPALAWTDAPPGTRQFALLCDDPDAPRPKPWVHWLVTGIPGDWTSLPEGVSDEGLVEGRNDFGDEDYGGPMPPPGHGVHHYRFRLFALATPIEFAPGYSKEQLLAATRGRVLAEAELVGTYERR